MREAKAPAATTAATTATTANVSPKQLERLVTHVLRSAAPQRLSLTAGLVRIGEGGPAFPQSVLDHALQRGLVQCGDNRLAGTAEARSYLKRARIAANEEQVFAGQHRDLVEAVVERDTVRHKVSRNLEESPLSALARLKEKSGAPFFSPAALDAGERLAADFTRGNLQPRITASWEPRLSTRAKGEAGGMADLAESAMAARARFGRAMQAIGPELSGVAADVCCFCKGLELVERERQWPARSAKLMLRTALLVLARHYAPPAPVATRRSHHWGAEDFRPDADAYGRSAR